MPEDDGGPSAAAGDARRLSLYAPAGVGHYPGRVDTNRQEKVMRKSRLVPQVILLLCVAALFAVPASAGTRIGGGLHYLKTVGELSDVEGFDENDFGFIGSVAFNFAMLRADAQVEVLPDFAGTGTTMWQPQGYLLLGNFIYGGVGIGVGHLGDYGWLDPFWDLRAGVDFALGGLDLDVYATYRFQTFEELEGVTTDDMNAVTLAAVVRFGN
jgi:hypothetical protein